MQLPLKVHFLTVLLYGRGCYGLSEVHPSDGPGRYGNHVQYLDTAPSRSNTASKSNQPQNLTTRLR